MASPVSYAKYSANLLSWDGDPDTPEPRWGPWAELFEAGPIKGEALDVVYGALARVTVQGYAGWMKSVSLQVGVGIPGNETVLFERWFDQDESTTACNGFLMNGRIVARATAPLRLTLDVITQGSFSVEVGRATLSIQELSNVMTKLAATLPDVEGTLGEYWQDDEPDDKDAAIQYGTWIKFFRPIEPEPDPKPLRTRARLVTLQEDD